MKAHNDYNFIFIQINHMDPSFITYISQPKQEHKALEKLMNSQMAVRRTHSVTQDSNEPMLKDYLPLIKEWKCTKLALCTILSMQATNIC